MIIECSAEGYSFKIDLANLADIGKSDVLQHVKCRRLFAAGRGKRSTRTARRVWRVYGHPLPKDGIK